MQITTDRINTLLRWCEYTYVVVLLIALTQGPVLTLWFQSGVFVPETVVSAQQLTFVGVQIPALLLLGYRRIPRSSLLGPVGVLGLFCLWMWLSTFWATFGQHTIVEASTLCVTFLTGVYLARSFSLLEQMILVVVSMQPCLIISRFAIAHQWQNSATEDEHWIGIYFNRNSLAPVAMVSCLAASALLWIVVLRRGKHWPVTLIIILVDVILFGAVVLFRTGSNTAVGGAVVFSAVWAFWTVIRSLVRRKRIAHSALKSWVYSIFLLGVVLLTWITVRLQGLLLSFFGETVDFNGRSEMWHFSWTGFLERPIKGWGWMSAWRTQGFLLRDLWWSFTNTGWSHSGYMDILLGGGVIGATLFIGALVWGSYRHVDQIVNVVASQWTPAIMFFVLAAATQESFFIGNHFLWVLLVAAIAGNLSDNPNNDDPATTN